MKKKKKETASFNLSIKILQHKRKFIFITEMLMHFYKDFTCLKSNRHHDFKRAVQNFLRKNQKDGRTWSVRYIDKGCHKWESSFLAPAHAW